MNSKLIASAVIALSTLAGASAFAQDHLYGEAALAIRPVVSSSEVTRAQVQNNNFKPGQNGDAAAAAWARNQTAASNLTRAEVRSQAQMSARANLGGRSAI